MSSKRCIIDNKSSKKLLKLADGNLICEDHAKLTPWQKEELIEKDANQVNEYIDNLTNKYLTEHGVKNTESSYKSLLHKTAESDLLEGVSPEETLKLQNWILIKQNNEIIRLLKDLKTKNKLFLYWDYPTKSSDWWNPWFSGIFIFSKNLNLKSTKNDLFLKMLLLSSKYTD